MELGEVGTTAKLVALNRDRPAGPVMVPAPPHGTGARVDLASRASRRRPTACGQGTRFRVLTFLPAGRRGRETRLDQFLRPKYDPLHADCANA